MWLGSHHRRKKNVREKRVEKQGSGGGNDQTSLDVKGLPGGEKENVPRGGYEFIPWLNGMSLFVGA